MTIRNPVWIVKRRGTKGFTWSIRWIDPATGKKHSRSFGRNKALAQRMAAQKRQELTLGLDQGLRSHSFPDLLEEFLEAKAGQRCSPSTLDTYRFAAASFQEACQPGKAEDIDFAMIQRFIAAKRDTLSIATVNTYLRHLRAVLNFAVKAHYLRENPMKDVGLLREPEQELRVLTPAEVELLLTAAPSLKWRGIILAAVSTGMRKSELTHLRWEDIDLENGIIRIVCRKDWQPKGRRNRQVPFTSELGELLTQLWKATPKRIQDSQVIPASLWVFPCAGGEQWGNNLLRDFKVIVRRAGIAPCTLHDLRRTFCSTLAAAGVNEAIVQKLAGHADIKTTLKYYTNLPDQAVREAVARLPFGAPRPDSDRVETRCRDP